MIDIRPIEACEWQAYRDMRLWALRDAPDAFGSTYQAEATRSDEAWGARIAAATSSGTDRALFALNGKAICGLTWCKLSTAEPSVAEIFQMWVAPASRGLGAGRALLHTAITWAQSMGVQRVRLGVTVADSPAMRLYQALGFRPAGPAEPLREGSSLMAQAMELELVAA